MKKAIIFSGPQGSGKTWTASGIMNFFLPEKILHCGAFTCITEDFYNKDLAVIGCKNYQEITLLEDIMRKASWCNFIFETQTIIDESSIDTSKYHLVLCQYNPLNPI